MEPYIYGGYQSHDIFLKGPNGFVTWGPGLAATSVEPNTDYEVTAKITNPTDACYCVTAMFWQLDGGVVASGMPLGVDSRIVRPNKPSKFVAPMPFHSPGSGHSCAAVALCSIEVDPTTPGCNDLGIVEFGPPCTGQATNAGCDNQTTHRTTLQNPGVDQQPSQAAWRNTDTILHPESPKVCEDFVARQPDDGGDPREIPIEIETLYVPSWWKPDEGTLEDLLGLGWPENYPFYLMPSLVQELPHQVIDQLTVSSEEVSVEQTGEQTFLIGPTREARFTVCGVLPEVVQDNKVGEDDRFVMRVKARYGEQLIEFAKVYQI